MIWRALLRPKRKDPGIERTLAEIKASLIILATQGANTMSLATDINAATKDLKAKVDKMQENQAKVEQMLADLIANGGLNADDKAALEEAHALLTAEAADVDADNADSPANPPAP